MFNSPILDLALALSFTYFILGLVVSTIHELFYSVFGSKRGRFLKQAIDNLFSDGKWAGVAEKIFSNANIQALKKTGGKKERSPSYIPAKSFALALLDQFRTGHALLDMNQVKAVLLDDEEAAKAGIDGQVRKVLLSFCERAKDNLTDFQKQIEDFFNDAMDRAAGVYKRSTHKVILVISIIVAVALNADTIQITQNLWGNKPGLQQTADNIEKAMNHIRRDTAGRFIIDSVSSGEGQIVINASRDTAVLSAEAGDTSHTFPRSVQAVKTEVVYLKETGVPLGWTSGNTPHGKGTWNWIWVLLVKVVGLLLTAAALMLGAPFWFDLINKFVNIRGAGKKPAEAEDGSAGNK